MSKNAMSSGQARSIKLSGDRLRKCFYDQSLSLFFLYLLLNLK